MNNVILSLFIAFILHHELNIGYYIRKALKLRISQPIKPLDCFPCFTFWLTILITLILNGEIYLPMLTFIIAKFYDTIQK